MGNTVSKGTSGIKLIDMNVNWKSGGMYGCRGSFEGYLTDRGRCFGSLGCKKRLGCG